MDSSPPVSNMAGRESFIDGGVDISCCETISYRWRNWPSEAWGSDLIIKHWEYNQNSMPFWILGYNQHPLCDIILWKIWYHTANTGALHQPCWMFGDLKPRKTWFNSCIFVIAILFLQYENMNQLKWGYQSSPEIGKRGN